MTPEEKGRIADEVLGHHVRYLTQAGRMSETQLAMVKAMILKALDQADKKNRPAGGASRP